MNLDKIFSSNMVFSANKPIRIYGSGKGQATLKFAGEEKTVTSLTDKWQVEFSPMTYGGPYKLEFIYDKIKLIFDDIYIGEVYLFSGQSNMELKINETNVSEKDYKNENMLRLFSVDKIAGNDYFGADDGWVKCKRDEVGFWPALAYLSGNSIIQEKNIAIGIISCSQGASVIESWIPDGMFENMGINIPINKKMSDHRNERFILWNKNALLYKMQFLQSVPFAISAVVWYQGESDTSCEEARVYDKELCALIDIWRRDFKSEELPFFIIQLADYKYCENPKAWSMIKAAQLRVQEMRKNVKTVICSDVCENDDIHPKTKDILAKRIAKALLEI